MELECSKIDNFQRHTAWGYAEGVNEGYSGKKRASLTCHTLFRYTMFLWTHLCLSNAFPHSTHTWGQVYPMSHFEKGASDF